MIWHSAESRQVVDFFDVDASLGLRKDTADAILEQTEIDTKKQKPAFLKIFFSQLNKPFFILMMVAAFFLALVSIASNYKLWVSTIIIVVITILDALWNSFEVYRSEYYLYQIKELSIRPACVLRDGVETVIPCNQLVRGDIIILKEGDCIPCDARLIETINFRCDEYALTGETVDVKKDAYIILEDITEISARVNMVFAECTVMHGSAKAIVTDTGEDTEIEKARLLNSQNIDSSFAYEKTASTITKYSLIVVSAIAALVFLLILIFNINATGRPFVVLLAESFADISAMIVAAIPETLPATVAVIIGFSLKRLKDSGVIINNYTKLEKISKISVICADKTGILTDDNMIVEKVYNNEEIVNLTETQPDKASMLLLKLGMICGNGIDHNNSASHLIKDSTEKALCDICAKYDGVGSNEADIMYPMLAYLPFDNERMLITSVNMVGGKCFVIVKGAPENLIPLCPDADAKELSRIHEEMADTALRVIAVGYKLIDTVPAVPSSADLECDLTFAGFICFADQPSKDCVDAVSSCAKSGIRTVMITGDHLLTAKAVARRLGILPDNLSAITGHEIAVMSDEELDRNIDSYSVFARVTPDERYRIIRALQHNDEVVAVTGSNTHDAPILRRADVGIALENSATAVAKNASDIVISDTRFSFICNIIKTCKNVFINIRKVIHYLLSCNIGELLVLFSGTLIFGIPILAASQILLVNLLTDALPCLTIGLSENDKKMPRGKANLFTLQSVIKIAINALCFCTLTLISFGIGNRVGAGQTLAFLTLCISQILHLITSYSEKLLLASNIFKSPKLFISAAASIAVIMLIVLTPVRNIFGFTALSNPLLFTGLLLAVILFALNEITKIGFAVYEKQKK